MNARKLTLSYRDCKNMFLHHQTIAIEVVEGDMPGHQFKRWDILRWVSTQA
jgi:hypothetical protein